MCYDEGRGGPVLRRVLRRGVGEGVRLRMNGWVVIGASGKSGSDVAGSGSEKDETDKLS